MKRTCKQAKFFKVLDGQLYYTGGKGMITVYYNIIPCMHLCIFDLYYNMHLFDHNTVLYAFVFVS